MKLKFLLTLNLALMTNLHAQETATKLPVISTPTLPSISALPQVDHVIIVEFENIDYSKAMAQPTFNQIAADGANLTNFYAETHPSQPNYLAMISGSMWGVKNDKNVDIDGRHIGDLLEEAGKTWKVYADDYPGHCFLGAKSGEYVRKHVPFLSFKNIQDNPERCASIVEGGMLTEDLLADSLPTYSLYIPNMSDDGHDTGVAYADNWVKTVFLPKIQGTLPKNTLVVFTFDESSRTGGNHIYTAFYGDVVKAGSIYSSRTDHYGFLRTIEALLGLPTLSKEDEKATIIDGIWN